MTPALTAWNPATRTECAGCSHAQADEDSNLDNCVLCGLGGNLICCDGCPAAVHLRCIGETAKSIPDGEWLCAECRMGSRGAQQPEALITHVDHAFPVIPASPAVFALEQHYGARCCEQ